MRSFGNISGLGLVLALYAHPLLAAPFCVESQGIPPECIYVDAGQCRQRAHEQKGLCVVNPDELTIGTGTGKYCLVDSSRIVQCNYSDFTSCDAEAKKQGAVCIETVTSNIQRDPYQLDPNRKY